MTGAKFHPSIADQMTFQHQPDAYLSQANPVSGTLYEVLPTTRNVRLLTINSRITWAVTQPTPLEIVVTIDGVSFIFIQGNPVSAANNYATMNPPSADAGLMGTADTTVYKMPAFLLEGRSVRVQVRITWAVTQPTPLECRVRWARR